MVGVAVPPLVLVARLRRYCQAGGEDRTNYGSSAFALVSSLATSPSSFLAPGAASCELYLSHPVAFVNLLYFLVVDVGFYLVYVLQASTWLIDPHWQLIPVAIAAFWFTHPDSGGDRAVLSLGLVVLWAARLLHNYFRFRRRKKN